MWALREQIDSERARFHSAIDVPRFVRNFAPRVARSLQDRSKTNGPQASRLRVRLSRTLPLLYQPPFVHARETRAVRPKFTFQLCSFMVSFV